LIGGRLQRVSAAANEQIGEQLRDLAAIAVADLVDLDAGARHRRSIEAIDPFLGGAQQFGLARHHEDGIHAGDGLQLDHMLAKALFPRIQDLFELGDHRLRRRVMDWKNTDRLAAHPILIETQDGLDGGAALYAIANHKHQIFRGIGPDRARFRRKTFQELRDRLHRDMTQGDDRDPIAGLRLMVRV
jgi:hypothetical protein